MKYTNGDGGVCANGAGSDYMPRQGISNTPPIAQGQFDSIVNALDAAISGYEDAVQRLNYLLEAPKPACSETQKQAFAPQTVQEAVAHAVERLHVANGFLRNIIERLQEQVGELKILP